MVKIRRNRQPKDWAKMTHERSGTSIVKAGAAIKVNAVTTDSQIKKVSKKEKRLSAQIAGKKEEKKKTTDSLEQSILEQKINLLEHRRVKCIMTLNALKRSIESQEQRQKTLKANEEKEKELRLAKHKKFVGVPRHEREGPIQAWDDEIPLGGGRRVEKIVKVDGSRKKIVKFVDDHAPTIKREPNPNGGTVKRKTITWDEMKKAIKS